MRKSMTWTAISYGAGALAMLVTRRALTAVWRACAARSRPTAPPRCAPRWRTR